VNDLHASWAETTLGDLISGFEAGRNLKANGAPAAPGQYGVLKISAVTWGEFNPEENKALVPGDKPKPHEVVRAGDLLISRANTSELVGAVVRVRRTILT
jgi:type I restriction enzyme S subunit